MKTPISAPKTKNLMFLEVICACDEKGYFYRPHRIAVMRVLQYNMTEKKVTEKREFLIKSNIQISDKFVEQHGITKQMIEEEGMSFDRACRSIVRIFQNCRHSVLMTWGMFEYNALIKTCKHIQIIAPFGQHINLKSTFALVHGIQNEVGLSKALELIGFTHEETSGKYRSELCCMLMEKMIQNNETHIPKMEIPVSDESNSIHISSEGESLDGSFLTKEQIAKIQKTVEV